MCRLSIKTSFLKPDGVGYRVMTQELVLMKTLETLMYTVGEKNIEAFSKPLLLGWEC